MKRAIYPGSFDPLTNGHLEIIERAVKIFDEVIVLLAINPHKKSDFTLEERLEMMKAATKYLGNKVKVDMTTGLSVLYAKQNKADFIVRGLRHTPDFEYEHQIASGNEFVDNSIEMVFLMGRSKSQFITSSMIKELHIFGVDVSKLAPPIVVEYLNKKIKKI